MVGTRAITVGFGVVFMRQHYSRAAMVILIVLLAALVGRPLPRHSVIRGHLPEAHRSKERLRGIRARDNRAVRAVIPLGGSGRGRCNRFRISGSRRRRRSRT